VLQLSRLTAELLRQWTDEAAGSVVLYQWAEWLRNDALRAVNVSFPWVLGVTREVPSESGTAGVFWQALSEYNDAQRQKVPLRRLALAARMRRTYERLEPMNEIAAVAGV